MDADTNAAHIKAIWRLCTSVDYHQDGNDCHALISMSGTDHEALGTGHHLVIAGAIITDVIFHEHTKAHIHSEPIP
jgi:hypothetical protein